MKQRPKNAPTCVLRWCDVGLKWSWADVQQGLQIYHSIILATSTTALTHQFSNYYFTLFLVVSSKFQSPVSRGLTKSNGGEWIHCFVWWEPVSQRLMSGDTTACCPVFVYVYISWEKRPERGATPPLYQHSTRRLFLPTLWAPNTPCTVCSDDIPKVTTLISSSLANMLLWKF